jgi:hypothetical protein
VRAGLAAGRESPVHDTDDLAEQRQRAAHEVVNAEAAARERAMQVDERIAQVYNNAARDGAHSTKAKRHQETEDKEEIQDEDIVKEDDVMGDDDLGESGDDSSDLMDDDDEPTDSDRDNPFGDDDSDDSDDSEEEEEESDW